MSKCPVCQKETGDQPTLHLAKCLINLTTKTFEYKIPKTKPYHNVSKLLDKILSDALQHAETKLPKEYYSDQNFPRLIRFVKNLLIFISENDGHYRAWLAWIMVKIQTELNISALGFNSAEEFVEYLAQHPLKVGEE